MLKLLPLSRVCVCVFVSKKKISNLKFFFYANLGILRNFSAPIITKKDIV